MPPRVSPVFLHASISAIILLSASGSATRTCEFSDAPQFRDAQLGMSLRFGRADTRDVAAAHLDSERSKRLFRQAANRQES